MKKNFTILAGLLALLAIGCTSHDKATGSNTTGMDTVKTDSGITIVKNKEGQIIQSFPTPKMAGQSGSSSNTAGNPGAIAELIDGPYYIKGTLIGGGGGNITLDRLGIGNDIKPLEVQTATKEGQFGFVGTCSQPQLMQLRMPAGNIHLIVRPNDTIDITTSLEHTIDYKVKGSLESVQLRHIYDILEKANSKKDEVEDRLKNARSNKPLYSHLLDLKPTEYGAIDAAKHDELRKYITKIDTSFVCMMAALYLDPKEDIDFMVNLDKKMVLRYPASKFYQALHEKVTIYGPIATNMYAPEVISQTPEGKTIKLSELKGKYVLLNFWSSYDPTSKTEMANIKKAHDKYQNKGLEVVSYSIDKEKNLWTKAIIENKMNWINISDLLGYQSAGAGTYIVTEVPVNFLIDKDGRIVARNLFGSALQSKLAQLMH